MDEPTSRAWSRPELIVIVRGKQEETVLAYCKNPAPTGDNSTDVACRKIPAGPCNGCDSPATS